MRKKSLGYVLFITFISTIALNMAHPVTPMLIRKLGLPAFMFGVFFAAMSLGNFLFSPIFGSLSDKHGRIKYLMMGLFGYGISQLGFGFNSNPIIIVIFRFLGGAFVVSYLTTSIAYLSDITTKENRLKYMTYYSAVSTIGGSLGSLLGGVLGNNNYKITFFVQFLLCTTICGIIYLLFEETIINKTKKTMNKISLNMFSFKEHKDMLTPQLTLVMIMVIIFYFASTSYNSSINYYIESVLNLPPTFNGVFLSVAGIIGFLANLLITPYLGKRFGEVKSFKILSLALSLSVAIAALIPNIILFFIFIIIFVAICSIYVPIQQNIVVRMSKNNYGAVMGIQNSAKAIGMITGSLFSGFIFEINSKLPFLTAAILLGVGFVIGIKSSINLEENN
ncbi:MFS transporter [Clostridium tarantellae]|uniref:MFS transporter n=1 Tax=Clostridium tarantellae TaxID=39493 RepID=A0A6I1MU53_9CLOT|nr:MFS transporter [Clostridium tarantellae]MPQ44391.1 MFS transporter [Clostridium tarantellae]